MDDQTNVTPKIVSASESKEIIISKPQEITLPKKNYNVYISYLKFSLCVIIICCLLFYMYNTFYENQMIEPFIEKTVKSDVVSDVRSDSIDNFNVLDEICNLKVKQTEYLQMLK